jgi:small subunit ribosomal protein S14
MIKMSYPNPNPNTAWLKSLSNHRIHLISQRKQIDSHFNSHFSDQKRRKQFEKRELSNLVIKSVLSSTNPQSSAKLKLSRLSLIQRVSNQMKRKTGSITRIRNRCVVSGKSSIIGKLPISRIRFRQLASLGLIPGLVKI